MSKIPVSVLVPVKNEEMNLQTCLPRLCSFDQVIVIDSSSTDGTKEICEEFGYVEYQNFVWNGAYPKKRNWALENLNIANDWVLFLDADEQLTNAFIKELRENIEDTRLNGFWLTYTNHFMGERLKFGDKMRKLALFKKSAGQYEKIEEDYWSNFDMEIHEHPIIEGEAGEIKKPIIHDDYRTLSHYIHKHNEYSDWEAYRFVNLSGSEWSDLTFRQQVKYRLMNSPFLSLFYFIYSYIFKMGLLDGKTGYYFAKYKATYFFQIYTKIRELKLREKRE